MKRLIPTLLSSAALFLAASSLAQAHGIHIVNGPTFYGTYAAGASGSFTVPQFDPSLGTLTEVDLLVTGHSDGGSNSIENQSANPGSASVTIGTNITVSGPSALTVLTLPQTTASGGIAVYDGVTDFLGLDTLSVAGLPSSDSQSDSLFGGFGPYLGLSTVSFNYSSGANTTNSATVSPTFSATTPPMFDFDATVIYHYEQIPEPGTLALFGIGAVALLAIGRARRRNA